MKRLSPVLLITLLAALLGGPSVSADPQVEGRIGIDVGGCIRPDLEVYVWPDRGVDGVYHPGDPISIFFEVTRDCYVVLYDLDTRGRLHILFPFDPWQDNFVQAGRVYELPGDWDDFALTVEGPTGTEYIQAIASPYPFDLPDWPIYINSPGYYPSTCPDPAWRDFRAGNDRIAYIHRINRKLTHHRWEYCATDLARFYVQRRPLWRPPPYERYLHLDPWPDIYYGDIYIGWPIGARIYIDGIFIGIAPCYVPRLHFGYHWIRCYDGHRLLREQRIRYRHKRAYRKDHPRQRFTGRFHDEIFRTAPGVKVKKTRPTVPAAGKGYKKSKPAHSPAGKIDRGRSGDSRAWEKSRMSGSPGKRVEKNVVHRAIKTERTKKRSGFSKFIAAAGRAVAGELKKSDSKRRDSSRVSGKKSTGGKKSESTAKAKSNKNRSSSKKKNR